VRHRSDPGSSSRVLVVLFAAIVVLAALAATGNRLAELRAVTRNRSLDGSAFGSRDLTRVLGRIGSLHSLPDLPHQRSTTQRPAFAPRPLDQAFSLDELRTDEIELILGIDPEWIERGVPTISLLIDPDDVTELEENARARGRDWERPAHFTWIEDGRVQFSTRVGWRIHGGLARSVGRGYSYRIYFRRSYGQDSLPADLFPTGGERPAKRVILRKDSDQGRGEGDWHFTNAISQDIARRIGLPTAYSQPAAAFVNGEFTKVRAVIERIDRHWLISHHGHDDFSMARTKRNRLEPRDRTRLGPPETYNAFRRWAVGTEPLDLAEVSDRVDIDNLVRWTLLVQMVGVIDFRQGTALLDLATPDSRWHWVPWDLNISLGIWNRPKGEPTRLNSFVPYFTSPRAWSRDSRLALVGRLLATSDEFRIYFSTVFDEIYNHRLTRDFRWELIGHYRETAERFGLDTRFLRFVRRFLLRRPDELRGQLQRNLGYGPTHDVHVDVPPGARARIDGFDYLVPYEGRYTHGSRLRLGLSEGDHADFIAWQIGEQRITQADLEIDIDGPLDIRLVTGGNQAEPPAAQ